MEKQTLLAVVLMAALLIVYQIFFPIGSSPPPPKHPDQTTAQAPKPESPAAPAGKAPESEKAPGAPAPAAEKPRDVPRPPQRLASVQTPLYRAVVSSEGGKLQEMTLKYRGEKPMVMTGDLGPAGLVVSARTGAPPEPVPMVITPDFLTLGQERPQGELVLTGERDGLRIREVLQFRADDFVIESRIRVENVSGAPRTVTVSLPWTTRQAWHEAKEKFTGQHPTAIIFSANGHVELLDDLCSGRDLTTDGAWIGTESTWYLAVFIPRIPGFKLVASLDPKGCAAKSKDPVGRAVAAVQATPTIAAGEAWEGRVTVYAGPKEYDRLKAHGLEGAINFGGFPLPRKWGGLPMEWLGVPILLLMKWVHRYVGNYGLAIILLTVVSKVLFYPLTVKGMRSMKAMQALQPQVNALRSKYKSDPGQLQKETLELYRKHKVNPMGGCLPMVAQVPVFYALYLALSVSVELQNAGFLCFGKMFGMDLWICDLASQDPTYVLPIFMGVTMFVQQKMTPMTGDPRQAKMMLFMPVVFTFMFLNLPSGLVLYWTVSNILQILQQYYMDRTQRARTAHEAKDASRA